jgi:predicted secreted protein
VFRKILLLLIMCVMTLSISSCTVTSVEYHVELTCDQFAGNIKYIYTSDLAMEVGDKIILELCSNQTTGFKWNYEMSTDGILDEMESWTFKAVQKGTTQIKMEYSQPWEGGTKAEWTYTLTVTVESVE